VRAVRIGKISALVRNIANFLNIYREISYAYDKFISAENSAYQRDNSGGNSERTAADQRDAAGNSKHSAPAFQT
jgi:hypothetical protein